MNATMLMAVLTGITVAGILLITLRDCWPKIRNLPRIKLVEVKMN